MRSGMLRRVGGWAQSRGAGSRAATVFGALVLAVVAVVLVSCAGLRDAIAPPARVAMYSVEPEVRVRVRKGATSARVEGPMKLVVRPVGGGRSRLLSSPVSVRSGIGGLVISDARESVEMGFGIDAEVVAYDAAGEGAPVSEPVGGKTMLRLDGVNEPGFVLLRSRSDEGPEKFDVIGVMPIEDYLPGVIVKEMYTWWPREAFDVQAVCARSYALHERDRARRGGKPFDLEASTLDQAYSGATTIVAAQNAVNDTRGVVITERGQLVRAYYSSACGGRAAAAADVWPTGPGFEFNRAAALQGKSREFACEASTLFRWQVTRSDEELSQRLRAWGRSAGNPVKTMGRLRSVEVERASASGRSARYRVTDDKSKAFSLSAEELRVACNQSADGLPPITKESRVNSGDVMVEVRAGVVKISGRGFGHGVGMCQWCAKGMAEKGQTWREMLAKFYPGVEVVRVY